ncbi:MAG: hypothetical protein IPH28_23345 [Cytophagaceae bacterium]|nr:hypothetical protein [Cytophagaceae bacterium]
MNIALGMLLNGADTDTKNEIQKMLGYDSESMEEINKTYKELIDNLPLVDPKVVNTIANSVWQNKNFTAEKALLMLSLPILMPAFIQKILGIRLL